MIQLSPQGAYSIIQPLIFFIIGIAIYSIIVYNLYRFVATRDIFEINLRQYNRSEHPVISKFLASILYLIEYLIFFPLFLMVWFVVFAVMFIAMSIQDFGTILLISMALVASVRIASYYKQNLARDIAKLVPFALLAVFLIEGATTFNWSQSTELIKQIPAMTDILIYYFAFVFILELILRAIYSISKALSKRDEIK
ncbi:hypothetical protein HOC06_01965 [Candidatus Woesearchaeota archaeon]|jgi:hypothetical protein|nr:hypothetical protein [Candidatus Woesearchaeota archaeon]MBT4630964.1 hypothetical protein [Candidatus Woesearchaeota archaeon]